MIEIQTTPGVLVDPLDEQIAMVVAQSLEKYYPGHEWRIEADRRKGLIDVLNVNLSGSWGFRLFLDGHATASELDRLVMRMGGELLERYQQPRGAIDDKALLELPQDAIGRHQILH